MTNHFENEKESGEEVECGARCHGVNAVTLESVAADEVWWEVSPGAGSAPQPRPLVDPVATKKVRSEPRLRQGAGISRRVSTFLGPKNLPLITVGLPYPLRTGNRQRTQDQPYRFESVTAGLFLSGLLESLREMYSILHGNTSLAAGAFPATIVAATSSCCFSYDW